MKAFLKFSGIIAAALGLVGFILMMALPGLQYVTSNKTLTVDGTTLLFGHSEKVLGATVTTNASALALIGWIIALLGILALCFVAVIPFIKVKALENLAGLIALCGSAALIVAGVLMFFAQPTFVAANTATIGGVDVSAFKDYTLTPGWIIAAILEILAGACGLCPTIMKLVAKK